MCSLGCLIPLLELVFIMSLKDLSICIRIISFLIFRASSFTFASCKFGLHFMLQVIVHHELSVAGLLYQPRSSFLICHFPMVVLFQVRSCLHNAAQHLKVRILDVQHLNVANIFIKDGA